MIYGGQPNAFDRHTSYIPAERGRPEDSPFVANFNNTGLFDCGHISFSMYVPEKMLHHIVIDRNEWIQKSYWGTDWSEDRKSIIKFICTSSNRHQEIENILDGYLNAGYTQEDLYDEEDIADDSDGSSILVDHSKLVGGITEFDIVYKKNQFGKATDPEYVFFKSKSYLDLAKNIIAHIDIWYYTDTYSDVTTKEFQAMFDTLNIIK
jgi:hypothetical protein